MEKEKIQMQKVLEKNREEDRKTAESKKERIKIMMDEVAVSNKAAMKMKEEAAERERERDAEIEKYNKQKIAREEAKAAELKRLREEKEREVQRLRDLQEKAADRQSEMDELRARRAFEEREMAAREAEKQALIKKEKVKAELEEARLKQFRETDQRLADYAKSEREAFLAIVQKQKQDEEQEKRLAEERARALKEHQVGLNAQISKNAEVRNQDRLNELEEGRKTRDKI